MEENKYIVQIENDLLALENEINGVKGAKPLEELGTEDLRKIMDFYKEHVNTYQNVLNIARTDTEFSNDKLKALLDKDVEVSEKLKTELEEINQINDVKNQMIEERKEEREKVEKAHIAIQKSIEELQKNLSDIMMDTEMFGKVQFMSAYEELIEDLKNQDKNYTDRLVEIDEEIKILENGGPLPEIKERLAEKVEVSEEAKEKAKEEFSLDEIEKELEKDKDELGKSPTEKIEDLKKRGNELSYLISNYKNKKEFFEKEIINQKEALDKISKSVDTDKQWIELAKVVEVYKKYRDQIDNRIKELENELKEVQNKQKELEEQEKKEKEEAEKKKKEEEKKAEEEKKKESPEVGSETKNKEPAIEEFIIDTEKEKTPEVDEKIEEKPPLKKEEPKKESLKDLIENGKLPSILEPERIIEICNKLNINVENLDYVPTAGELARINNDADILLARTNQRVMERHNKAKSRFVDLINEYEEMKSEDLGSGHANLIEHQEGEVKEVVDKYRNIKADTTERHAVSSFSRGRLERIGDKLTDKNDELRESYKELDVLKANRAKFKSPNMQKTYDNKIRKMEQKIQSLQKKVINLSGKQTEIINKQTDKYIENKGAQLFEFREKQDIVIEKVDKLNSLNMDKSHEEENLKNLQADYEVLARAGRADSREAGKLQSKINKTNDRITKLQNKAISCDRSAQKIVNKGGIVLK